VAYGTGKLVVQPKSNESTSGNYQPHLKIRVTEPDTVHHAESTVAPDAPPESLAPALPLSGHGELLTGVASLCLGRVARSITACLGVTPSSVMEHSLKQVTFTAILPTINVLVEESTKAVMKEMHNAADVMKDILMQQGSHECSISAIIDPVVTGKKRAVDETISEANSDGTNTTQDCTDHQIRLYNARCTYRANKKLRNTDERPAWMPKKPLRPVGEDTLPTPVPALNVHLPVQFLGTPSLVCVAHEARYNV
jgi:hypothetical protein